MKVILKANHKLHIGLKPRSFPTGSESERDWLTKIKHRKRPSAENV
jgi:hypothetical protein